jgi:hypothetical protein
VLRKTRSNYTLTATSMRSDSIGSKALLRTVAARL